MYTAFYGLRELPFDLSPNPRYLLMTPRHREALANLQYGISSRKSITLLLGEAGTGQDHARPGGARVATRAGARGSCTSTIPRSSATSSSSFSPAASGSAPRP